jgi:hypothetical protein
VNLFHPDIAIDPVAQRLVRAWTGGLRSGRFPQATGRLRTDDGWCVLGVACHTYDHRDWRREGDAWTYLGCREELPAEVADAFRLRTACGRYGPLGSRSLVSDNDEGTSFAQLTDLIDRHLAAAITSHRRRARRRGTTARPVAGAGGTAA